MSDHRPPKSPRKGKHVNIRIAFLNDTIHVFQVPVKGTGALLWDAVIHHLQLLEADYFDLEYTNSHGDDCWLEKDKTVLKQLGSADTPLRFCVKFYTPDPGLLEDELTRFLFVLQIRKDLLRGEIRCSENTAALLSSYVVQGEIGDYDAEEYLDPTYLTIFKFVPEHLQNHEFMAKVMDYHKQHIGESPSEADLNLLDTARKVEMYGVKMQTAKDHEGVSLNLAVAHLGVLVFQQHTKINTFSWAKIRKLSFKRKKFLIKLHPDTYGYYKDTVEFFFETRDRCKLFWKRCIEHHAFFRCQVVSKTPRAKSRVVSRGSSFRYTGKTQKQLVEFVRENIGKRPLFERSTSGRISCRSTSVTPKIAGKPGMHSSSADLHTSSGSRSSGSHILDSNHTPNSGMHSTPQSAIRVESVDVHSDSSMSGSRSLNSPRLEHGLSLDQDVIEAVNARTEGAMTDEEDEEGSREERRNKLDHQPPHHVAGMSHVASEPKVYSAFKRHEMRMAEHRQMSTPSFGGLQGENGMDHHLARTSEIENIPEVVEEDNSFTPKRYSLNRETRHHVGRQESIRSDDIDDLPPPPPSPPPLSSPSPPPPPPPFEENLGGEDEEEEDDEDDTIPPPPEDAATSAADNFSTPHYERGFSEELEGPRFYLDSRVASEDHTDRGDDDDDDDNNNNNDETEDEISDVPFVNHTAAEAPNLANHDPEEKELNGPSEEAGENYLAVGHADLSGLSELSVAAAGVVSASGPAANSVNNNNNNNNSSARVSTDSSSVVGGDKEDEHRRRGRHRPSDTAYYIAKELLMTERTYKKDLEVLCVWFRNAVSCDPAILNTMSEMLFSHFDPIYNFHYAFLKEVEHRLATWEGKTSTPGGEESQRVGDILLNAVNTIQQLYDNYFDHLEELLTELDTKIKKNRHLEELCRGFESQKVCYLPLNTFFLRPGQRLLHFKLILERLVKHYSFTHPDTEDSKEALCRITEIINANHDKFQKMENLQKLMELQRDLIGLENLIHIDREFIREGCLQKFSRKGYQQRMFFLFSDMLVYTSRTSASLLQFKVHGQLPLRGMTVEETDPSKSAVVNSFAIYAGNKYILVAASSQEEKDKWIEDINEAVTRVKTSGVDRLQYPSLKSSASSSENVGAAAAAENDKDASPQEKPIQHRANTTTHVCWHRNTSVSMRDHEKALRNHLSGYLLRKFKSSNGWQKLWVVFTNFCLFFYKTYQDDYPLASLPLLGYAVNTPEEQDGIHKDHVFKLQFKNHVYFFRAESEYTFSRWMEVINWATHSARRIRIFSRLDSRKENNIS